MGSAKYTSKIAENHILYIKKFWSLIMYNEQLFNLTLPPSAEFDTAQELLQYCNNHAKQNGYALATKNSKREKKSQSNVILKQIPRSSKASNHRKKTNIIQAQQLSIWDKWQTMLVEIGDFLSKYQIITILVLHLRCIQCISVWMIQGIVVVTVLWEKQATTPSPVLNNPEYGNPKPSSWRASHGMNIQCRSCFFK